MATKTPKTKAKKPPAPSPAQDKPPEKNKGGRPSKKTKALVDEIARRLSKGEPLAVICRDPGFPDPSTVWDWMQTDPEVSQAIAHARDLGYDHLAEECLEIANDGTNDWMEKRSRDGDLLGFILNGEAVARSKLRIETRLKLLAKWNPKKYGEFTRNEISGPGGKDLVPATIQVVGVKAPRREK